MLGSARACGISSRASVHPAGRAWGKSCPLDFPRLDLGADEEGHELIGGAQGAAVGGARHKFSGRSGRWRPTCPAQHAICARFLTQALIRQAAAADARTEPAIAQSDVPTTLIPRELWLKDTRTSSWSTRPPASPAATVRKGVALAESSSETGRPRLCVWWERRGAPAGGRITDS